MIKILRKWGIEEIWLKIVKTTSTKYEAISKFSLMFETKMFPITILFSSSKFHLHGNLKMNKLHIEASTKNLDTRHHSISLQTALRNVRSNAICKNKHVGQNNSIKIGDKMLSDQHRAMVTSIARHWQNQTR